MNRTPSIVAPVDFSKASYTAAIYAAQMAKKIKGSVTFVHVVFAQASARAMILSPKLEEELRSIALEEMAALIKSVRSEIKGKIEIRSKVLGGFPVAHVIDHFVQKEKFDMIVTGTQGATGLKKVFVGTNAAALIESSTVPVLVVPRLATFRGLKKLVYATDLENLDSELKLIVQYLKPFAPEIHVVHVMAENEESDKNVKKIRNDLATKIKYPKLKVSIVSDDDITGALDNFMIDKRGDVLVMFTHQLGFWEKILSRSTTRKLVFHSHIPLLTFNKSKI
ncbi:MAG TPA: universal stress protein [Cyclobacteriaceae bacterium]|nr:universal stress protein [Cyclobacteriaceae bacterium]